MKNKILFCLCAVVIITAVACSTDKDKKIPDVSKIPMEIKLQRFDKELLSMDTNQAAAGLKMLREKYPTGFMDIFISKILLDEQNPNLAPEKVLEGFVKFPSIRKLLDTCQIVYGDGADLERDFSSAFKYYKYYFPQKPTPQVVTFISEYGLGAFTYGDSTLAIGLDFFLGENYPAYDGIFPNYIRRTLTKPHLVSKAVEAIANDLVGLPSGNRLLDMMIQNGKKLYIKDLLLPNTPDSIKLEYTQQQVKWCEENEKNIWAQFLSQNLLYSAKMDEIRKLVSPSPNAPGMPAEAPGRTANWIGLQIIRAFMQQNPSVSPEQMLAINNAQVILDRSKYKPKR